MHTGLRAERGPENPAWRSPRPRRRRVPPARRFLLPFLAPVLAQQELCHVLMPLSIRGRGGVSYSSPWRSSPPGVPSSASEAPSSLAKKEEKGPAVLLSWHTPLPLRWTALSPPLCLPPCLMSAYSSFRTQLNTSLPCGPFVTLLP